MTAANTTAVLPMAEAAIPAALIPMPPNVKKIPVACKKFRLSAISKHCLKKLPAAGSFCLRLKQTGVLHILKITVNSSAGRLGQLPPITFLTEQFFFRTVGEISHFQQNRRNVRALSGRQILQSGAYCRAA